MMPPLATLPDLLKHAQRQWRRTFVRTIRELQETHTQNPWLLPWKPQAKKRNPKIYFSVSSEGFGHSSRALALAKHMPQDEFVIATYHYAHERLKQLALPVAQLTQEVQFIGDKGTFDVGKTILQNQSLPLGLHQLVQEEVDLMKRHKATMVVADGRIAPVLAAARLDLPCVVLTNQSAFYPFFAKDATLVKLFGLSFDWMMNFWFSNAEEIFIPDFPPPYSVCLHNLSENPKVKKRTRFVGPLVPWTRQEAYESVWHALDMPYEAQPLTHQQFIARPEAQALWDTLFERDTSDTPSSACPTRLVLSLGGHAYRLPLLEHVIAVAQHMPQTQWVVLASFVPESLASSLPANMRLLKHVTNPALWFATSHGVVTQAGHSTAMELLTLGVPMLVVPDTQQIEQEHNAQRLAALGVASVLTYGELSSSSLQRALQAWLSPHHYLHYAQRAEAMAEKATSLQGASYTASLLREYAQRLTSY
ncbi:MAG: glycosyltransferase [Vampirovibrionales bacterium]